MSHEPSDLGHLSPHIDPDRWEGRVRSIMAGADPELRRLAIGRSSLALLSTWMRPLAASAATIILLASATLLGLGRQAARGGEQGAPLVAEAIAPQSIADWMLGGAAPTAEELLLALQGGQP